MKNKLSILLLLVATNAFCQNPLHKSTNLIRGNDVIIKQQVEYKSPGRSGEDILWNFSQLYSINDSCRVSYQSYDDSTFVSREHRTLYYYSCNNDSLFLNGYENPTIKMQYSMPELRMIYPFGYGMSFNDPFYGEGTYSQKYKLVSKGVNETVADGVGMMILPSNDTLYNVTRIYSKQVFTEQKSDLLSPEKRETNELTSKEVIVNLLKKDSILFQIDTYQWYADGYRYPIFEVIESAVCKTGNKQDYFKTAFFYSPYVHDYLENDPENLAISSNSDSGNGLGTDSLSLSDRQNKDDNSQYKDSINQKQNHKDTDDSINSRIKYNYYPSVVVDNLYLEMYIPYDTEIDITLYNSQGKVQKSLSYNSNQNNFITESMDLSAYTPGIYFLQVKTNKEFITEKIIKK